MASNQVFGGILGLLSMVQSIDPNILGAHPSTAGMIAHCYVSLKWTCYDC